MFEFPMFVLFINSTVIFALTLIIVMMPVLFLVQSASDNGKRADIKIHIRGHKGASTMSKP